MTDLIIPSIIKPLFLARQKCLLVYQKCLFAFIFSLFFIWEIKKH